MRAMLRCAWRLIIRILANRIDLREDHRQLFRSDARPAYGTERDTASGLEDQETRDQQQCLNAGRRIALRTAENARDQSGDEFDAGAPKACTVRGFFDHTGVLAGGARRRDRAAPEYAQRRRNCSPAKSASP